MNAEEFRLLADKDEAHGSVLDTMTPPTLNEWTAAFAELKARGDWFDQQGILPRSGDGSFAQYKQARLAEMVTHGHWSTRF